METVALHLSLNRTGGFLLVHSHDLASHAEAEQDLQQNPDDDKPDQPDNYSLPRSGPALRRIPLSSRQVGQSDLWLLCVGGPSPALPDALSLHPAS